MLPWDWTFSSSFCPCCGILWLVVQIAGGDNMSCTSFSSTNNSMLHYTYKGWCQITFSYLPNFTALIQIEGVVCENAVSLWIHTHNEIPLLFLWSDCAKKTRQRQHCTDTESDAMSLCLQECCWWEQEAVCHLWYQVSVNQSQNAAPLCGGLYRKRFQEFILEWHTKKEKKRLCKAVSCWGM